MTSCVISFHIYRIVTPTISRRCSMGFISGELDDQFSYWIFPYWSMLLLRGCLALSTLIIKFPSIVLWTWIIFLANISFMIPVNVEQDGKRFTIQNITAPPCYGTRLRDKAIVLVAFPLYILCLPRKSHFEIISYVSVSIVEMRLQVNQVFANTK